METPEQRKTGRELPSRFHSKFLGRRGRPKWGSTHLHILLSLLEGKATLRPAIQCGRSDSARQIDQVSLAPNHNLATFRPKQIDRQQLASLQNNCCKVEVASLMSGYELEGNPCSMRLSAERAMRHVASPWKVLSRGLEAIQCLRANAASKRPSEAGKPAK